MSQENNPNICASRLEEAVMKDLLPIFQEMPSFFLCWNQRKLVV